MYTRILILRQNSPLQLQSQQNINVTSGQSRLSISPDAVTIDTPTFTVSTHDSGGQQVLSVTEQSVVVTADSLEVYTLDPACFQR